MPSNADICEHHAQTSGILGRAAHPEVKILRIASYTVESEGVCTDDDKITRWSVKDLS